MNLITPLGLLALAGIAILILIYILKPNYQQKVVSSTLIWKLSLRYRKKKIPISRLRNILILICQLLIITACAFILAQPFIPQEGTVTTNERIFIVDASASMQTQFNYETRFERAISKIDEAATETLQTGGYVTIIYADNNPYYVCQRAGIDDLAEIRRDLKALTCTYGSANIDNEGTGSAMSLAETVLEANSQAEVLLYTDMTYLDPGKIVTVVNVSEDMGEWNAAILDVNAEIEEAYYRFSVKVACYGRDERLTLKCVINGFNGNGNGQETLTEANIDCFDGEEIDVVFSEEKGCYAFDSLTISIVNVDDSYDYDNSYSYYGGSRPTLRVQYCSSLTNRFYNSTLESVADALKNRWNIYIKETKPQDYEAEGYDFYIFENTMPNVLPVDGVSLLAYPDTIPYGLNNLRYAGEQVMPSSWEGTDRSYGYSLNASEDSLVHPLLSYTQPSGVNATRYRKYNAGAEYVPLLYCEETGDPVYYVRNDDNFKVAILGISLQYSTLGVRFDFPIMIANLFEYFLPSTLTEHAYEVGDTVSMNSRGNYLTMKDPDSRTTEYVKGEEGVSFPVAYQVTEPGTYELVITPYGKTQEEYDYFFVRTPSAESDINCVKDLLNGPIVTRTEIMNNYDLLIYFAAALVTLLFLEWILQAKEHF